MMFRQIFEIAKYYRVDDWIHYLGYILISSILVSNIKLINFILSAIILAYAYSLNDYYDKKMKKKCFIVPLILYWLFVPFISYFSFIISLLFLILFTFYSWPKVWLEGKPILSTLTNSIGFTLIFVLPINSIKILLEYYPLVMLIFTLNTAAQLLHEIVDYKEDKKIKKITTAVNFGIKRSLFLFKICLLIVIFISFLHFYKFLWISISSIIFATFFLRLKKVNKKIRKKFKFFGIMVGIVYLVDILTVFSTN